MKFHHLAPSHDTGRLGALALALLLVPAALLAAPGDRSPDGVWTVIGDEQQTSPLASDRQAMPEAYHAFRLDASSLEQILATAPLEQEAAVRDGALLTIPMPDGSFQRFAVVESPILSPEAQALIPEMRTYLAQGVDDPTATLRFDVGYWGFRAFGRTSQGTLWVDPWELGDREQYLSAWTRDFAGPVDAWECGVTEDMPAFATGDRAVPTSGDELHVYRMIPTLTGEYGQYFGGISPALNAATTTINRVNSVYEVDAAVRFTIVAWVAYDDPASDPFPSGDVVTGALLDQNQAVVESFYGTGGWDIGHILTQGGGGGLAQLGVVCDDPNKARGGTGRPVPQGDPFDIDYVAHEIGHQMNARHTFNGSTGACNGNRTASSAYEPGSGSTIMAYAGICGGENLQSNSDPYFHVHSLEQMIAFRDATSCQAIQATGNTPPTVFAGNDFTIPRDTPFYVIASGDDADGDPLTYCWEQYDLGAPSPPTDPFGPLFRSFNPNSGNFRYFPDFGQILSGAFDQWEQLPSVDRSLTLRVTVRDNRAGGGGVADDELELTVAGAPFEVIAPNGGEIFTAGQPVTVTWDVGGGSSVSDVVIYLFTGGFTNLSGGPTPNDGIETVIMPCGLDATNGRIWIDGETGSGVGVRFFDVSDADFTLTDGLPDFAPVPNFAGWGDSVVPSPTADQTFENAPLPAELFGDATSYLAFAWGNYGNAYGCGDFVSSLRVDEAVRLDNEFLPAPGFGGVSLNLATDISGGRHTIWQINDPDGNLAESNEENNAYARQWVWAPQPVLEETQPLRAAPPQRFAGTEHLPDGTPVLANKDGLRMPPSSGYWRGAAISNPDEAADFDLYLHTPSSGVEDGFGSEFLAVSAAGGPFTDAVISNRNSMGNPDYDLGVLNWNGAGSDYRLENRTSDTVLVIDASVSRTVAENQMLRMEEFLVEASEEGPVTLELSNVSTDQPVTLLVYDPTFTEGSVYAAGYSAPVGPDGRALITILNPVDNFYGVAILRHAFEGTAAFTYDLRLWRTPADLAAVTLPGSHAPLIPRNNGDIPIGNPVPAPIQLDGDVDNTLMYFHMANLGPVASNPFQIAWLFDGETAADLVPPFPPEMPGDPATIYSQAIGNFVIRGGRHTAGMRIDSQNTNLEIFEDNNNYGEQWVWLPTQLTPESAVFRAVPPIRDGGWEDVADGITLFDNVDGLRSQTFEGGPNDQGFWGAVAVLPAADADLDVRLHDPTVSPDAGFDSVIEQSTWGGSSSDFVLIDFDGVQSWGNAWDAGVLRFAGETDYALQSVRSEFLNLGTDLFPSTYGPFAIPAGEVIGLYEFGTFIDGTGDDLTFVLDIANLGGGANLGVSVYARNDETGFYNKFEAVALADGNPAGGNESLEVTVPEGGYYGLVVWKVDHADFGAEASYEIVFRDPNATAVPELGELPTISEIEAVYPNPFNPQTTVRLAMRQAGRASVKIYNVQGRLVRTLVDGELAAGRHEMRWTGRDDAGRAVPSGVYFVRAVHPDGIDRRRMSLVK